MANQAISKPFPPNPYAQEANPPVAKKKRNLPGTPDPDAEVIALSPKTLLATNRFLCEICGKGFQRDQNLQLHRRGHNLPWKLRQRNGKEARKRVYVCPEKSCVHHHPSRALGDLTGIKKHFCRKHGEKKWKCDKCSKRYAVQSDWKAHSKTCGTREYRCDCGTLFSRRDSFITHRAFCDALAEETARVSAAAASSGIDSLSTITNLSYNFPGGMTSPNVIQNHFPSLSKPTMPWGDARDQRIPGLSLWMGQGPPNSETLSSTLYGDAFGSPLEHQVSWIYGNKLSSPNTGEITSNASALLSTTSLFSTQLQRRGTMTSMSDMSATALLQKAAQIGVTTSTVPSFLAGFDTKFDGMFNGNNAVLATSLGGNMENIFNGLMGSDEEVGYPVKRRAIEKAAAAAAAAAATGETRDFLGVGVQSNCQPSIDGWI